MKTIYKYPFTVTDVQTVEMPADAEVLCVQVQGGYACLWALVNPEAPTTERVFETFGTGHDVPDNAERKYIGTYQQSGGRLIFHVFELLKLA